MILSIFLNLNTVQVDYTDVFLHEELEEEVLVKIPRGYRISGKVLKLNRSLYGLKKSPNNLCDHLQGK